MVDVTIRGAGIFGLSLAWEALEQGASVRVVDPNGVGSGASGGLVGALQPHTPDPWNAKKQFQFESLVKSRDFWPRVEKIAGQSSGYSSAGRIMPLASEREVALAKARSAAAKAQWRGHAEWQVHELDQNTWNVLSPTGYFVHDTLSAILHPRQAVEALSKALAVRGADIAKQAPDEGAVIWATGWRGLIEMNAGNGVKGQAALFDVNATGAPQLYAEGLHIIPHLDGTVAVGSTSERAFETPNSTDTMLEDLIIKARTLVPLLSDARVIDRWAGVRPRAKSRAPLLGPWPDRPGHFIANGGFKIGFGMAPKCAETLIDLVLNGQDTIPADFHTIVDKSA